MIGSIFCHTIVININHHGEPLYQILPFNTDDSFHIGHKFGRLLIDFPIYII